MAETITAEVTAVHDNGFQVEGWDNWFNLSTTYQGIPIPPAGSKIEFEYNPWQNPKSRKTVYYVDAIHWLNPTPQVAAAPYDGMQQSTAPQNASTTAPAPVSVASTPVPTPAPVAEPPKNGPEPLPGDTGPVLGTQAYTSLSIERQVALKAAVETLNHCEGEYKSLVDAQSAVLFLAGMYDDFLNSSGKTAEPVAEPATPDDLVPLPSEMAAPPPEYTG